MKLAKASELEMTAGTALPFSAYHLVMHDNVLYHAQI
jgi:hypothetical protein